MTMRRQFSSLPLRLRTLFTKARVEAELGEEMLFHLERKAEELLERGYSADEARVMAMKSLQMERQMEQCRDARAWQWMEILRSDVRFGWRQLMKRKVTTAAAVLSLGLAIGACTAAFRLVDAIFLRPMPISDPQSLYAISYERRPTSNLPVTFDSNSYPFFQQAREAMKGQADVDAVNSAMDHNDVTYGSEAETEKAYSESVSGGLFGNFGLKATLGRLLTVDDDRAGANPTAVISYDYWERRFAKDPAVIGRTFRMHDRVYQIVGVGPKGFTGTEPGTITDLIVPLMADTGLANDKNSFWLRIYVRVRPGVDVKALQGKMNAVYTNWETARNSEDPRTTVTLKLAGGGISSLQKHYGSALAAMSALLVLVLLIACANVASLMNAQAATRAREMALRMSLGSGRMRLVRMVMVESAILGLMASAVGVVFAWWAAPFVVGRINPPDNPARLVLSADWMVVGFGLALAMGVTLLFGLLPALRASSVRPVSAMKGGEEPHARMQWLHGMIAAQVAFCFVVLFVAGLFATTFEKLLHQPMGFDTQRLLLLDTLTHTAQPPVKWDQMAAALRNVPGVQATALEDWALMSGTQHNDAIYAGASKANGKSSYFLAVSPGWVDAMRIPMIAGRDFRYSDATPSVAIVNETFAKRFFDGRNPVGSTFVVRPPHQADVQYEIVGLVHDVAYKDLRQEILPQVYLPIHRTVLASATAPAVLGALRPMRGVVIAVRTTSDDPMQMAEVLRRAVTQIDPEFRVSTITAQADLITSQMLPERMLATLAAFFAGVALLLAAIGLYGVLNYSVVQREREIGVRIALGAAAANIARLVTARVFAMVLLGAAVGVVLGMGSVRYVQTLLFGVKGSELSMLVAPGLVLLGAALLAALPAAVRATRIDPAIMLRAE